MDEARRCTARSSRTGRRCKKAAILGGSVCATHGGAAPQVKGSAKARLLALVDPALVGLKQALDSGDPHAVVRAATVILDRSGFGPRSSLALSGPDDDEGRPTVLEIVLVADDGERRAVQDLSELSTGQLREIRDRLVTEEGEPEGPPPAVFRTMPAEPSLSNSDSEPEATADEPAAEEPDDEEAL